MVAVGSGQAFGWSPKAAARKAAGTAEGDAGGSSSPIELLLVPITVIAALRIVKSLCVPGYRNITHSGVWVNYVVLTSAA
ncbi:hypothetical protein MBOU_08200 [Mycobacterium bourgelatii]|uniref:Uncharacterized protein n=1 Tax=Mycobacterium bourgelatii TaxID=1273442 RepID=A0A7I9YJH5_MYCBU|nr:hypothetical protein MBOU_08200 [Mycobacterium bourgelatii]